MDKHPDLKDRDRHSASAPSDHLLSCCHVPIQGASVNPHDHPPYKVNDPIQQKFNEIDTNHDGFIDVPELEHEIENRRLNAIKADDYSAVKNNLAVLYKLAHPESTETDPRKMRLTEEETAGLELLLPRYRSQKLRNSDSFTRFIYDQDDKRDTTEPMSDFKTLAQEDQARQEKTGKKSPLTIGLDDLEKAVDRHICFDSNDAAHRYVDPQYKGSKITEEEFKKFYGDFYRQ